MTRLMMKMSLRTTITERCLNRPKPPRVCLKNSGVRNFRRRCVSISDLARGATLTCGLFRLIHALKGGKGTMPSRASCLKRGRLSRLFAARTFN